MLIFQSIALPTCKETLKMTFIKTCSKYGHQFHNNHSFTTTFPGKAQALFYQRNALDSSALQKSVSTYNTSLGIQAAELSKVLYIILLTLKKGKL